MLVERKIYTDRIKGFFGTEPVKVIIGMRRCGKSGILGLVLSEALKVTDERHIIHINFEDAKYKKIRTYEDLDALLEQRIVDDGRYYVFLDEVQNVTGWESSVNSLRLRNTDIYVTGSNSKLLSGELATLLAGRYVAFEVGTLSFSEFIRFRDEFGIGRTARAALDGADEDAVHAELDEYIRTGGFPMLSTWPFSPEQARQVIEDIHASAVLKDVVARNSIRNVPLLEKIIDYIYDNVGNLVSVANIANYMRSNGGSADVETVSSYLSYLENGRILQRAQKYDVRGKRLLESNDKYYLADHSLQYAVREVGRDNLPGILENIVYNELVRRGHRVYVGKAGEKEIDFVAERPGGDKMYVQVCTEFGNEGTVEREFAPLVGIRDHYPKYVVTLDKYWRVDRGGVKGVHLADFLLGRV